MGIVWIASYPKSGNTWVRFLLANYLAGPITYSRQVETLIPSLDWNLKVQQLLAKSPRLHVKTHFPWSTVHPHAAMTERALVIVRHPRDLLFSALDYHRLTNKPGIAIDDATYARNFITLGGDPQWVQATGYGPIADHIGSWTGPSAPSHLLLRYEDLKADAAAGLSRILAFLAIPADAERINRAAAASSFAKMRELEVREKAGRRTSVVFPGAAHPTGSERFFMSKGRSGSTLASIDPSLDAVFDERFGPLLDKLGYR